jgi:hypothetical protein
MKLIGKELFYKLADRHGKFTVSFPPRHGLTSAFIEYIGHYTSENPTSRVLYATYSQNVAEMRMRVAHLDVEVIGVNQSPNGKCFDLIVVDSPYRCTSDAFVESSRTKINEWFQSSILPRLKPDGIAIVGHSRMHVDDLVGVMSRKWKAGYSAGAVLPNGEALIPDWYSIEKLNEIRADIGEVAWNSLYMGFPQDNE